MYHYSLLDSLATVYIHVCTYKSLIMGHVTVPLPTSSPLFSLCRCHGFQETGAHAPLQPVVWETHTPQPPFLRDFQSSGYPQSGVPAPKGSCQQGLPPTDGGSGRPCPSHLPSSVSLELFPLAAKTPSVGLRHSKSAHSLKRPRLDIATSSPPPLPPPPPPPPPPCTLLPSPVDFPLSLPLNRLTTPQQPRPHPNPPHPQPSFTFTFSTPLPLAPRGSQPPATWPIVRDGASAEGREDAGDEKRGDGVSLDGCGSGLEGSAVGTLAVREKNGDETAAQVGNKCRAMTGNLRAVSPPPLSAAHPALSSPALHSTGGDSNLDDSLLQTPFVPPAPSPNLLEKIDLEMAVRHRYTRLSPCLLTTGVPLASGDGAEDQCSLSLVKPGSLAFNVSSRINTTPSTLPECSRTVKMCEGGGGGGGGNVQALWPVEKSARSNRAELLGAEKEHRMPPPSKTTPAPHGHPSSPPPPPLPPAPHRHTPPHLPMLSGRDGEEGRALMQRGRRRRSLKGLGCTPGSHSFLPGSQRPGGGGGSLVAKFKPGR